MAEQDPARPARQADGRVIRTSGIHATAASKALQVFDFIAEYVETVILISARTVGATAGCAWFAITSLTRPMILCARDDSIVSLVSFETCG